jgi:hypothetical protein
MNSSREVTHHAINDRLTVHDRTTKGKSRLYPEFVAHQCKGALSFVPLRISGRSTLVYYVRGGTLWESSHHINDNPHGLVLRQDANSNVTVNAEAPNLTRKAVTLRINAPAARMYEGLFNSKDINMTRGPNGPRLQ